MKWSLNTVQASWYIYEYDLINHIYWTKKDKKKKTESFI